MRPINLNLPIEAINKVREMELSYLERESIKFIQLHEPPEGYQLNFSGGKDSIVLLSLAKKSHVQFVPTFRQTHIEDPKLYTFLRREYPEVQFTQPKVWFWKYLKRYGPPSFRIRWCCQNLKEWQDQKAPYFRPTKLVGLRAEESPMRAKRGSITTLYKCILVKPIFDWPEWAVWAYIRKEQLPWPSQYRTFRRQGCIVCPLALGSAHGRKLQLMYPRWWAALKHWASHWYDLRVANPKSGFLPNGFPLFWDAYLKRFKVDKFDWKVQN